MHVVLSHDLTIKFHCHDTTQFQVLKIFFLNHRITEFDAKNLQLYLRWSKYVHAKKLGNNRVGKKMFLCTIPPNNTLFDIINVKNNY